MPATYSRKSERATSYTRQDLKIAIEKVRKKELTNVEASRLYGIPTSTLSDRVRQRTGQMSNSLGRPTVIPAEMEESLAECLRTIEKWGWGFSRIEVLELVQRFIKKNGLVTPFRDDKPGNDWFIGFRKRHKLSIKKPQPVEYLRKKMTDPFVINEYFTLLEETLTNLELDDPDRIWNLDETSVCLDPTKTKVVGGVGAPCVRTTTGSGRENITVLAAVNAAGRKLNPLVIFKGKHMYEQWMAKPKDEYDFELAYAATKRGWIETETFYNYMSKVMIPSLGQRRPVLIVYDGHSTHIDEKVVALAVENQITILKLPAHTSHLLQPLDLAVFKSFKSLWDMKLVTWQRHNIGVKIQKQQFAELFGEVWHQTTPSVIQSGFKKGGIYPFNPAVIPKEKFNPNAYKRWIQHKSKQSAKPLTKLCIDVINKFMTGTCTTPDSNNQNIILPTKVSFEQLLLEKVAQQPRTDLNKTIKKMKRVAKGAEVITNTFLEKKKETELTNEKDLQKSKDKKPVETTTSETTCDSEILSPSGIEKKKINTTNNQKKKNTRKTKESKAKDIIMISTDIADSKSSTITSKGKNKVKKTQPKTENIIFKTDQKNTTPTKNYIEKIDRPSCTVTTPESTGISLQNELNINSLTNVPELAKGSEVKTKDRQKSKNKHRASYTSDSEIPGPSGIEMKNKNKTYNQRNTNLQKPNTTPTIDVNMILTENKKTNKTNVTAKGKGKGKKTRHGKENITSTKDQKTSVPTKRPRKKIKRSSSSTTTPESTAISLQSESDIDSIPDNFLDEECDKNLFEELTREEQIEEIVKEMYDAEKQINNLKTEKNHQEETNKKVCILSSVRFSDENRKFYYKNTPTSPTLKSIDTSFDLFTDHKNNKRKNSTRKKSASMSKRLKYSVTKMPTNSEKDSETDEGNDEFQTYQIGDTVLSRYHTKGWKYYVGVIENVDLNTRKYTIGYYKTIVKKDFVKFVIPKRKDQDDVPESNIVKCIELLQFNEDPVEYTLMNDEDSCYF